MSLKNIYIVTASTAAALVLGLALAMLFSNTLLTAINTVCGIPAFLFFAGGAFFVRGHVKNAERLEMERELDSLRRRTGKVQAQ